MEDPAITQHFDRSWDNSVFAVTKAVLGTAEGAKVTTAVAADTLADEAARQPHPVWGPDRPRHIMASLAADAWVEEE